jgi:hypothetical protein
MQPRSVRAQQLQPPGSTTHTTAAGPPLPMATITSPPLLPLPLSIGLLTFLGGAIALKLSFSSSIAALPSELWSLYLSSLETSPAATKTATALLGCFTGDLLVSN